MKNLILIGMMGSGKTTIGKVLAEKMHYKHLDTDDLIVSMNGFSINDIFNTAGEAKFRELESLVIDKIISLNSVVISTGGGIILNPENVQKLKSMGTIIYLKGSVEQLEKNLEGTLDTRPLLKTHSLDAILMVRNSLYEQAADWTIEIDHQSVEDIVTSVLKKCDEF